MSAGEDSTLTTWRVDMASGNLSKLNTCDHMRNEATAPQTKLRAEEEQEQEEVTRLYDL